MIRFFLRDVANALSRERTQGHGSGYYAMAEDLTDPVAAGLLRIIIAQLEDELTTPRADVAVA